jgi:hypothetical protein
MLILNNTVLLFPSVVLSCCDLDSQKVRRSEQTTTGNPVFGDAVEMSCHLRRWEHSRPTMTMSPVTAAGVFGDGSENVRAEIVLCPLHNQHHQHTPFGGPGPADSHSKFNSSSNNNHKPPLTSLPKPVPLRLRNRSSFSDIASLAFEPTEDQLENMASSTMSPPNGGGSVNGTLRRRRNLSSTYLGALDTTSPTSAGAGSCTSIAQQTQTYRIQLSDIERITRPPPLRSSSPVVPQQTVMILTAKSACYELYFNTENSYSIALAFVESVVPESKRDDLLQDTNTNHRAATNTNNVDVPKAPSSSKSKQLNRSVSGGRSASKPKQHRSGSFNMDQFMEQKMQEGVDNEGAFERFKRKMSKLSTDMNECKL